MWVGWGGVRFATPFCLVPGLPFFCSCGGLGESRRPGRRHEVRSPARRTRSWRDRPTTAGKLRAYMCPHPRQITLNVFRRSPTLPPKMCGSPGGLYAMWSRPTILKVLPCCGLAQHAPISPGLYNFSGPGSPSQRSPSHRGASHRIPSHRSPSHRNPSHRSPSHKKPSHRSPSPNHRSPSHRTPNERRPSQRGHPNNRSRSHG